MELVIRSAKPSDAKAIIDYCNQVATESDNLSFGENEFGITYDQEVEHLTKLQESPNSAMLMALSEGQLVGLATIGGGSRKRIIHNVELGISVKKAYWQQGIGSELLKAVIAYVENTNLVVNIHLLVVSDNLGAIKLYQKHGFKEVGRYARYHHVGAEYKDVIIMEYSIPAAIDG